MGHNVTLGKAVSAAQEILLVRLLIFFQYVQ